MSSVSHFKNLSENRGIDIGGKCAYLIGSLVSIGQLFKHWHAAKVGVVLCCRLKVLPDIVPTKCGTSWPVQVSLKQPKGPYSLHHALKLFWKHIIVFSR